jgi:probable rRNA maturation factor
MSDHEVVVEVDVELPLPEAAVHGSLVRAAEATLAHTAAPPATLTILLVDDERIAGLNREFLGEDKPTDVLSFPGGEPLPGMEAYLGDIAIAIPVAAEQARVTGHQLLDELALLTVHGVLHLLGHDHAAPDEQQAMWRLQDAVLAGLDLPLRSPAYGDSAR